MANLIITVISIALVAVAALMGAYYGGSAFLEGQSKANANTLVAQADQISAAWTLSSTNNGGSWDAVGTTTPSTVALLTSSNPVYLTAAPTPPSSISSGAWTMVKLADGTTTSGLNGLRLALTAGSASVKVCQAVAQMASGTSATPTNKGASSFTDYAPGTGRKFDCVYTGASSTIPASTDTLYITYRTAN